MLIIIPLARRFGTEEIRGTGFLTSLLQNCRRRRPLISRKRDAEFRAWGVFAAELDRAAMGFDDFPGDGQSQAGAGRAFLAWNAEKLIENLVGELLRYSRPGVGDREHNLVPIFKSLHPHPSAARGELQRVAQ